MANLLAKLDVESVDWVGTSMGGLIGMALAYQPETPIARLVLNDVGPVITAVSLARIGTYLGTAPRFDGIAQAEAFVRLVSAPFGSFSDAQWRHLTVHVTRTAADGRIEFAYDPGIAQPFREMQAAGAGKDVEMWPLYDGVACPTLLLRGESSDLLTHETAACEMAGRGPRATAGRSARRRSCADADVRRTSGAGARVFAGVGVRHFPYRSAASKDSMSSFSRPRIGAHSHISAMKP
jgi:pimeloyl-ACP methyl ester carboxylesterase